MSIGDDDTEDYENFETSDEGDFDTWLAEFDERLRSYRTYARDMGLQEIDHSRSCLGMILPTENDLNYCLENGVLSPTTALLRESITGTSEHETVNEVISFPTINGGSFIQLGIKATRVNPEKRKKHSQEVAAFRYLLLATGSIVLLTSVETEEIHLCAVTGKCIMDSDHICTKEELARYPNITRPNKVPFRHILTWKTLEMLPVAVQNAFREIEKEGYVRLYTDPANYDFFNSLIV